MMQSLMEDAGNSSQFPSLSFTVSIVEMHAIHMSSCGGRYKQQDLPETVYSYFLGESNV